MTGTPTDGRLEALITAMEAKGYLPDPNSEWKEVIRRVPRHVFVPARGWLHQDGGSHAIDRDARPVQWWDAVYADAPIVTQADDGATDPTTGQGQASSSLSAISGVLYNLGHLDLDEDLRVLEIGTGTGYTAALAVSRVGEGGEVTSVEVDPEIAEQAAANLEAAIGTERMPLLLVGDGAAGHPAGAPFDRVHVTCSVQKIPYVWVEQTRPGGVIVTPFGSWFGWGLLTRIDVMPDGTGLGRFPGTSGYMHMRSQRPAGDHPAEWSAEGERQSTKVNPRTIAFAPAEADLAISVLAPGISARRPDDALWLFDGKDSDCWAIATFAEQDGSFEVQQHGTRRLWDEVEAAYFQWLRWGRPALSRFGMTVAPEGQHAWLDDPARVIGPE